VTDDDEEDRRLVARFLGTRDERAFRAVYRRHAAGVYGLALRLSGGQAVEADDVAQEAWVRAVRALGGFRWQSRLRSWLCGIAVNVWRERRRDPPPAEAAPAEAAAAPAADGDLARVVASLPAGAREVLLLHDVEGYTHAEIAALLGIEAGTSKSQLSRARAALRAALASEGKRTWTKN